MTTLHDGPNPRSQPAGLLEPARSPAQRPRRPGPHATADADHPAARRGRTCIAETVSDPEGRRPGVSLQNVKLDKRSSCLHTGPQMTAPATLRTTSISLTRLPSLALGLILLTVILILPL